MITFKPWVLHLPLVFLCTVVSDTAVLRSWLGTAQLTVTRTAQQAAPSITSTFSKPCKTGELKEMCLSNNKHTTQQALGPQ